MKKTISTRHILQASASAVWANIRKATGVHEWLPVVTACHLEGKQRVCVTEQGTMNETILVVDDAQQYFQYSIDRQPLLPIEDVVGTMQVLTEGTATLLQWELEFALHNEAHYEMVKQAIEGLYAAGAKGLEKLSQ